MREDDNCQQELGDCDDGASRRVGDAQLLQHAHQPIETSELDQPSHTKQLHKLVLFLNAVKILPRNAARKVDPEMRNAEFSLLPEFPHVHEQERLLIRH
jgi:hypothetical protein